MSASLADSSGYDEPGWSPNELSEFAADLWESRRGIVPTSGERDMAAFVVDLFLTDSDAMEWLDRMQAGGATT